MKRPLFLEREGYRRRRLQDMARLTPVLGLFLFMVPLLGNQRFGSDLALLLVYFFLAWAFLIVLTFLVARGLRRQDNLDRHEERDG